MKLPRYAAAGIPEAWLVDLLHDAIEAHRDPGPEGYRAVRVLERGDRLVPLAFPNVAISVEEVLGPNA